MSHELLRLTTKLCNTPLMVSEPYLEKVMQIVQERNLGTTELAVSETIKPKQRSLNYIPDQKLGIVDIHGGITDIPYYGMCGEEGVSHQLIREEVKQLIDMGAKTIVFDQDSCGGSAHMAFESANYIRDLADENDVKLIGYISACSYSASYCYTAVMHEVISNPSAEAGSIGVRVQLRNMNGYMKKLGIEDIYVTAGDGKVPFDSEGKFTQEFLDDIQASVLEMYDQFTDHVAMWRGVDKKDVVALGARTFSSQKAQANGLVDKIMTLEEFKSYLEEITLGDEMDNPISNLFKTKTKDKEMSKLNMEELEASLSALQTEFTQFKLNSETVLAGKNEELANALAQLKAISDEKAALKTAGRKAELVAAVGTAQAETLSVSLANLSDADFQSTVNILKLSRSEAEEKFEEVGEEGQENLSDEEMDTASLDTVSKNRVAVDAATEKFLEQRYNNKGKK